MQRKPIAVGDPPSGRARGLGVSYVLELELAPIQLPWLIDELDELRGPLEEELQRERAACEASGEDGTEQLDAKEYELRLLRLMRARLPSYAGDQPVHFVGPSGMVETVVRGVMRNVASAVSELASERRPDEIALRDAAAAAAAWASSLVDCLEVVGFNFDPEAYPMRSW
jgi:hypothetical protein